jgi:hypothetical protein
MRTIKAIDTIYRGHRFRSRLEARWAVFFDWAEVPWEYEKEGYVINGVPYLPDFWLPRNNLWMEIKATQPTQREMDLVRELSDLTGSCGSIFYGTPGEHPGDWWYWSGDPDKLGEFTESHGGIGLMEFTRGVLEFFDFYVWDGFSWADRERKEPLWLFNVQFTRPSVRHEAFVTARSKAISARFEHGENPAPPWMR